MSRVYTSPLRDAAEAALKGRPMTTVQLAATLNIGVRNAGHPITMLRKLKRIHIGAWEAQWHGDYATVSPVYTFGPGEDEPHPSFQPRCKPRVAVKKPQVIDALKLSPGTAAEIAKATGTTRHYASEVLSSLRKEGLAHITGWKPPEKQGGHSPVYAWGAGEDAIRPPATDPKVTQEKFRKTKPEKVKAIAQRHQHKRKVGFAPFWEQLIGGDKPRIPMNDFPTPEPD